jgi:hypothetical protein
MTHLSIRRLPAVTLMVAVAALCLAACGSSSTGSSSAAASASSSSSSSGSGSGSGFNRTKFASCLKAHGVTLPTRPAGAGHRRPGAGGGGGFFGGGEGGGAAGGGGAGGGRFANPKLQAALKACGGANFAGRRRFTFSHAAVDKFVACVKQHGYDLPAPNFSGKGGVFPASIEKNKKFQAASKACASDLRPTGAPPGGGAGGGAPPPSA